MTRRTEIARNALSIILLVLVSVTVLSAGREALVQPETPSQATETPRCEEDQPCWDCATMGNRICGPGRGE